MGRAPCCDKANVKKGPWSPEEDAKLKSFIDQNGTGGNWITLPSKAGLKRCGKSCRLRWINYLRPDIKHGSFTEEEERTIYRYHAQIGSRWSVIAAQLPGRTDNDIKNYWNTRLKKKLLERGNTGAQRYGHFLHPYQQIPAHQFGVEDQMANAAAREGLLHGQHSYLPQYQQQYLPQQMQHQHQLVLPTVLRHHMDIRNQQRASVAPANGAVERERLMAIESSLRSIIVPDAAATGGGGANSHLLLSHRGSGSSDRNSLGIQIADSDSVGDPSANTGILGPQPQFSTPAPCSLLALPRFEDAVLFGEDLGVYTGDIYPLVI